MKQIKFKKWQLIFFAIFIVAFLGLKLWQLRWPTAKVELGENRMQVQVARTVYHQYRGLGKRDTLAPYDGLLFLYGEKAHHGIVMREMRFPIDIVWLSDGVVVDIAPNVQAEPGVRGSLLTVYRPRLPANLVLEVSAGWCAEHGVKIGSVLKLLED